LKANLKAGEGLRLGLGGLGDPGFPVDRPALLGLADPFFLRRRELLPRVRVRRLEPGLDVPRPPVHEESEALLELLGLLRASVVELDESVLQELGNATFDLLAKHGALLVGLA